MDTGNLFERKKAVNNMSERLSRSCCDAAASESAAAAFFLTHNITITRRCASSYYCCMLSMGVINSNSHNNISSYNQQPAVNRTR